MEKEQRLNRKREDGHLPLCEQSEESASGGTGGTGGRGGRGRLFLRQLIAAAVIIAACVLLNRSGVEFIKNCMAALGRAVRWEPDLGAAGRTVSEMLGGIIAFFGDALPFNK